MHASRQRLPAGERVKFRILARATFAARCLLDNRYHHEPLKVLETKTMQEIGEAIIYQIGRRLRRITELGHSILRDVASRELIDKSQANLYALLVDDGLDGLRRETRLLRIYEKELDGLYHGRRLNPFRMHNLVESFRERH